MLPTIHAAAPKGLEVELLSDQSTFVTRAIDGLVVEGVDRRAPHRDDDPALPRAAGAARSSSRSASRSRSSSRSSCMRALGHTINVMTLGGLALAVGILVDDATVEIENIHRNLAMGKPLTQAILDGAQQIAVPAFVASLCISIVFVSVRLPRGAGEVHLPADGHGGRLLRHGVVPPVAHDRPDAGEVPAARGGGAARTAARRGLFGRIHHGFDGGFERFRERYVGMLQRALGAAQDGVRHSSRSRSLAAAALVPFVGRDFFPTVDAGQIRLHVTAPPGHAHRGDRALFLARRGRHPRGHPRRGPREHPRPHRHAGRLQPLDHRQQQRQLAPTARSSSRSRTSARDRRRDTVRRSASGCRAASPSCPSTSSPRTSSRRSSTSVCRRRSTCRSRARSARRRSPSRAELEADLRKVPGAVDVHLHQIVARAAPPHRRRPPPRDARWGSPSATSRTNLLLIVSSSAPGRARRSGPTRTTGNCVSRSRCRCRSTASTRSTR